MKTIEEEILEIMDTYHEQEARPEGIDTPGGLEHMGDVWRLFLKWEAMLRTNTESADGARDAAPASKSSSGPQLLPCPFCGGEVCRDYIDDCWHRTIGCERCGISLWMSDEDWNQRAKSPETLRLEATVAKSVGKKGPQPLKLTAIEAASQCAHELSYSRVELTESIIARYIQRSLAGAASATPCKWCGCVPSDGVGCENCVNPQAKIIELESTVAEMRAKIESNDDFMAFMTQALSDWPCRHGSEGHGDTPPMMWPELIACIVKKAVADAALASAPSGMLEAVRQSKRAMITFRIAPHSVEAPKCDG